MGKILFLALIDLMAVKDGFQDNLISKKLIRGTVKSGYESQI